MATPLPVASPKQTRAEALQYIKRHRRGFLLIVLTQTFAALLGLVGPFLLGHLVNQIDRGTLTGSGVNRIVALLALALLGQSIFTYLTRRASYVLGEEVFAELRENFLSKLLDLPLSTVERAGTGTGRHGVATGPGPQRGAAERRADHDGHRYRSGNRAAHPTAATLTGF